MHRTGKFKPVFGKSLLIKITTCHIFHIAKYFTEAFI
jgi:hypothetical protein